MKMVAPLVRRRRATRFSWLRLLISLAICALAAPGTVPVSAAATDAAAGPAKAQPAPGVHVSYCSTCGFQQNFAEVQKFLEERYPALEGRVSGANYAVEPMKQLAARALGYLQLVGMVLMVGGDYIFRKLGLDTTLLQKALDNRIGCFAVILLVGSVSQGLVSTGAFEVMLDGELVFSKLDAGRWPTLEELSEILDARGLVAAST